MDSLSFLAPFSSPLSLGAGPFFWGDRTNSLASLDAIAKGLLSFQSTAAPDAAQAFPFSFSFDNAAAVEAAGALSALAPLLDFDFATAITASSANTLACTGAPPAAGEVIDLPLLTASWSSSDSAPSTASSSDLNDPTAAGAAQFDLSFFDDVFSVSSLSSLSSDDTLGVVPSHEHNADECSSEAGDAAEEAGTPSKKKKKKSGKANAAPRKRKRCPIQARKNRMDRKARFQKMVKYSDSVALDNKNLRREKQALNLVVGDLMSKLHMRLLTGHLAFGN